MGINLTWYCPVHKYHLTSMRGEEGLDFQVMVRGDTKSCAQDCLRNGNMRVMNDGYFVKDNEEGWKEIMDWDDRPAQRLEREGRYFK